MRFGPRTSIIVILILVLITGMVLIDLVMIASVKRLLINSETDKARIFLSALENGLSGDETFIIPANFQDMFESAELACAMIMGSGGNRIHVMGRCDVQRSELFDLVRESLKTGQAKVRYYGVSRSFFFMRHEGVTLSEPLRVNGRLMAAGAVMDFADLYADLRKIQYILLIYILINTIFLTFFGFSRLSRVTVKPVHKLLERMENYWEIEEDLLPFLQDRDDFRKLADTFNRMLDRILADKKRLETTVRCLEAANRDLQKAQDDVLRAEKFASVGRLSAGIAHEIGNPLAIVMGYLDLLKRDDIIEAERRDFARRIESEIGRIHKIIRQLLDLSRPTDGHPGPISVHEIIHEVVGMIRLQPLTADIRIEVSPDAASDGVMADAGQLRQVFLNILINAADAIAAATEAGGGEGRVAIRTTNLLAAMSNPFRADVFDASGGWGAVLESGAIASAIAAPEAGFIQIVFQDNGPGIPEDNIGNIFDPFYTTKAPGKGTGLGLSTSFAIIAGMKGRMDAESEPGRGAAIRIRLPLIQSPEENPQDGKP